MERAFADAGRTDRLTLYTRCDPDVFDPRRRRLAKRFRNLRIRAVAE